MSPPALRFGCALVLFLCSACTVPQGPVRTGACDVPCDGGDDDLEGGSGEPPEDGFFESDPAAAMWEQSCLLLEERVCGSGDQPECAEAPACAAAHLLRRYEAEECAPANANEVTYPSCRPGVCALLVDKVCGDVLPPASCEGAAGCSPSRELWRRSNEGSAEERRDAESSCGAALEDEVVFAACL